jgi:hypothetical protein
MCPPVVMVSRMDAQGSVHRAYRAANGTADDSTNRTSSPASLRSSLLLASEKALGMNRDRGHKESRDNGVLQKLNHLCLQTA